jgi:6-phosphogluconolactonase
VKRSLWLGLVLAILALLALAACGGSTSSSNSGSNNNNSGATTGSANSGGTGGTGGTGSGSSGGGAVQATKFLYGAPGQGVFSAMVGTDGTVTGNQQTFDTGSGAYTLYIAPDPKGRFVYTSELPTFHADQQIGTPAIGAFTLDRNTGTLTRIPGSPYQLAQARSNLVIDPAGTHIYIVQSGGIDMWNIDQNSGALTHATGAPFGTGAGNLIAMSPNGTMLFTVQNGAAEVWSLDATSGKPTQVGASVTTGSSNEWITGISPNGKFLFILNGGSAHTVTVMSIGANGALTQVSGSPFPVHDRPTSITFTPDSKFVYFTISPDTSPTVQGIDAYSVDLSTGNLTAVSGEPFATTHSLGDVVVDASGKYLYAATRDAGLITYTIGSNGALTQSSVATGTINTSQTLVAGP